MLNHFNLFQDGAWKPVPKDEDKTKPPSSLPPPTSSSEGNGTSATVQNGTSEKKGKLHLPEVPKFLRKGIPSHNYGCILDNNLVKTLILADENVECIDLSDDEEAPAPPSSAPPLPSGPPPPPPPGAPYPGMAAAGLPPPGLPPPPMPPAEIEIIDLD